jgi:hypothetical protein
MNHSIFLTTQLDAALAHRNWTGLSALELAQAGRLVAESADKWARDWVNSHGAEWLKASGNIAFYLNITEDFRRRFVARIVSESMQ